MKHTTPRQAFGMVLVGVAFTLAILPVTASADIDPTIFSLGVGYRF